MIDITVETSFISIKHLNINWYGFISFIGPLMHHVLERKNLLKDKNAFHGDTHILGLFLLYAMINDVKNKISLKQPFFLIRTKMQKH